ncbi:hypothetical protein TNIN_28591 [Trichonephila inaurata madagascariensis]|uniref:Reverse transcriptase domain-containing protein n=1 Tax=Trichonephila inaurata madagascariensis TaxID=2747483 RepID=A0A8X7CNI5_9ARAC|nr:hypothetical protein TNIN_28591 [Trichonephila inaurata madagascariensis]
MESSLRHRSWAGVPQESVLSPLLFLLYMNTVDDHIVNEAKTACHADDIAIWHSHTDITISENVLSENLSHIENWAKLLINPEKKKNTVFSTDRRAWQPFSPN